MVERRSVWLPSLALGLLAAAALSARADLHALNLSLSRSDMKRALALARWPHTDTERVRFHDQYLTVVDTHLSPLSMTPAVIQVEVVTEFRRLELIAEEHERAGDWFGRAGLDEVEAALKPWRGLVAIDVHFQLPGGCGPLADVACSPVIPPTDVSIGGIGTVRAGQALRSFWYARSGSSPLPLGNAAEAKFDAAVIGQTTREVRVVVDGRELARVAIDFGALE